MRYRGLIESDVPAIARVHRRACLIAYSFMEWSYSELEVRTWYAVKFKEWNWGQLAEHNGIAIGFVALTGTRLAQLFVDPDQQNQEVGTTLLNMALSQTLAKTTLHVFEKNIPARAFYNRHGFREIGRFLNEQEGSVEPVYGRQAQEGDRPPQ